MSFAIDVRLEEVRDYSNRETVKIRLFQSLR